MRSYKDKPEDVLMDYNWDFNLLGEDPVETSLEQKVIMEKRLHRIIVILFMLAYKKYRHMWE